ncbi:hypothetical protein KC19_2G090600 [Ceratodon purpureus]|uniref:Uncharacterized protein n=1 Tax=Ceratodon purpureus TaxID=3225 RepID=A0A8T0ITX5_CERPU|nr:hypothetical protein KC19_2G090600 [Ceratodon purpureus]
MGDEETPSISTVHSTVTVKPTLPSLPSSPSPSPSSSSLVTHFLACVYFHAKSLPASSFRSRSQVGTSDNIRLTDSTRLDCSRCEDHRDQ